jgi:HSP20 family protein
MAQATMVPVKNGDGKVAPAHRFGLLDEIEAEMQRFWHQPWSFLSGPFHPFQAMRRASQAWTPRIEVLEKSDAIIVKVELPGLKKEDVQVEVHGGQLIITGESKADSEVKEEDYDYSERSVGSLYRSMPVPTGVTPEQIEATLNDGVLEVSVPKPAESKPEPHKVPVS